MTTMKTPDQIAAAITDGLTRDDFETRADVRALIIEAIEADRAQREPAAAHAGDWEVTGFEDEAGKWVNVQTYDPDAEREGCGDEYVCAASILMSDVEALDIYRAIGSAIAAHTPALLPEYDTASSASRQHYIETGVYLTHAQTKEDTK